MSQQLSPIDVYQKLPGLNCAACGVKTCMGFASKLIARELDIEDCPHITNHPAKYHELKELLTPPVRPVEIGRGERARALGGEEVLYRHERTYFNPTALFVDVHDEMPTEELRGRVSTIDDYVEERIGVELTLDGVAVRCRSGEPSRFAGAVEAARDTTDLPLVLCTLDPDCMEEGLEAAGDARPLVYGATMENAEEMIPLAREHDAPLALVSGDLDELKRLSKNAASNGVTDVVLDPVVDPYNLMDSVNRALQVRRAAMEKREHFRYPMLTVPAAVHVPEEGDDAAYWEATVAAVMVNRWSDGLILHSTEAWALLPLVTLRQNVYQDPREPAKVESGLREMGSPDEASPVILTSNFALTYYTVESDVEGEDAWILVADTGGLAVDVAVAGDKLNEDVVKDLIEETDVEDRVGEKRLILPGKAGKLSGRIEVATGWDVEVGPQDSSEIPSYLSERERAEA
ncbi:MAG: Acetyl-CoA decarbonylase/synthase complex subunit gamma 1 [Methanonatronarchaeales archaeon]|nr:Acetyl-CoA decarbonylase/synthase complex subunit gamma 1 [Methanonatronarchaeales archaeon]